MKKERGAITIITLTTILFMLAFLISTFVIVANRRQAQAEIKTETKKIYESDVDNVDQVYQDYFASESEVIPIASVENLFKVGTNEYIVDGEKIYKCSANANYRLTSNIRFEVNDYLSEYSDLFEEITYTEVENVSEVTNYATANSTSNPCYTYTAPTTGTYKLEVWGAQGGAYNPTYAAGGKGAYATGTISLSQGQTIYACVGGQGGTSSSNSSNAAGGYNGGGTGVRRYSGGGGGASHIATSSGLLSDLSNNKSTVLIVAGGGGGAGYYSTSYYGYGGYAGGSGAAGAGYCNYYNTSSNRYAVGQGATTSSGGSGGRGMSAVVGVSTEGLPGRSGSFGTGGSSGTAYYSSDSSAGGGGAGYYGGGGAGVYYGTVFYEYSAGGGGGSSYVASRLTNTQLIAGNETMTSPAGESVTGHSGDGYARITLTSKEVTATATRWINIQKQKANGTLTGNFEYGQYYIQETDSNGTLLTHNGQS